MKEVKAYQKLPVTIEAIEYVEDEADHVMKWIADNGGKCFEGGVLPDIVIETLEGMIVASPGDYIIKGIEGEFYPCKPSIFKQSYKEVQRGQEAN